MLEIRHLKTGYGKKLIIDDVSLDLCEGEIVALIGHNGAGKSTILKSIIGVLPKWSGEIVFEGNTLDSRPHQIVRRGISMIPQGSQVFDEMTVQENLEVASFIFKDKKPVRQRFEEVYRQFPLLRERRKQSAGKLSGGEQQMLALGMALIQRPKLLLMDEPSLGLSPAYVKQAFQMIKDLNERYGMSILIVEQKVKEVLKFSNRTYVLRLGKVALTGDAREVLDKGEYKKIFLT
ncbi:MAG TPA: ABC transporter ATP-binding protein [Bacteroidetes bacterium]|nr:ABC transporter ATP-binding protein [Bacteroidota bacterium]